MVWQYYSDSFQSSISNHLNISKTVHRVQITVNTGRKHIVNPVKMCKFCSFKYVFLSSVTFTPLGPHCVLDCLILGIVCVICKCYIRYIRIKKIRARSWWCVVLIWSKNFIFDGLYQCPCSCRLLSCLLRNIRYIRFYKMSPPSYEGTNHIL